MQLVMFFYRVYKDNTDFEGVSIPLAGIRRYDAAFLQIKNCLQKNTITEVNYNLLYCGRFYSESAVGKCLEIL